MASSLTNRNNIIFLLPLLFVVFSIQEVGGEPPSVVPSACKRAYAVGGGSFTEDFCLSALTGHSAGAADNADLAVITVDLATANATATEAKIDDLIGGLGSSGRALYEAVVHVYQPDCHAAVKDGRYDDGKQCLYRTVQAPVECERWFEQRSVVSPVAREDDSLIRLGSLAIALTSVA